MRRKTSRYKSWSPMLNAGVLIALALTATALTVAFWPSAQQQGPSGPAIGVPASRIHIPAYTQVSREHIRAMQLDPERLPSEVYLNLSDIIGRVLARDKRPGYVFTEADFLPKGTRPGVAGAIPPGKRAFTIETDKIKGLHGLSLGDRFDIMGLFKFTGRDRGLRVSTDAEVASLGGGYADPVVLVSNGTLIVPQRIREMPYTQSSLTQGTRTRYRPVQESVIAVAPSEVQGLAQALSAGAEMYVVPRSGRPDAAEAEEAAGSAAPFSGVRVVETLTGGTRSRIAVAASSGESL